MTNTREYRGKNAPTNGVRSLERHYPGADDSTAQLVQKLRSRGITDPRAAVRRSSRALIEEEYKEAACGQTPKPFNNNYSPYSNVNIEAAEETARLQAEARRRAEQERLRQGAVPAGRASRTGAPTQAGRTSAAPAQAARRQGAGRTDMSRTDMRRTDVRRTEVRNTEARNTNARAETRIAPQAQRKTALSTQRRRETGQLAESGPREVAFRRVPFPKFALLIIFMCVVLFFMVNSIVRNYEQQRENAELRDQVEEYARQAELLRSELERRDDLDDIAERAEELGMIDGGMVDEKYIDLSGGDSIENFEEEDGRGSFLTTLSAMRKTLSRFLGADKD